MMKAAAIISNLLVLAFFAVLVVNEGMPNGEDWLFAIAMVVVPLLNLFALFTLTMIDGESWLALYFKRKRLEEKTKIAALSDDK